MVLRNGKTEKGPTGMFSIVDILILTICFGILVWISYYILKYFLED